MEHEAIQMPTGRHITREDAKETVNKIVSRLSSDLRAGLDEVLIEKAASMWYAEFRFIFKDLRYSRQLLITNMTPEESMDVNIDRFVDVTERDIYKHRREHQRDFKLTIKDT
jgi:hypothetical protein